MVNKFVSRLAKFALGVSLVTIFSANALMPGSYYAPRCNRYEFGDNGNPIVYYKCSNGFQKISEKREFPGGLVMDIVSTDSDGDGKVDFITFSFRDSDSSFTLGRSHYFPIFERQDKTLERSVDITKTITKQLTPQTFKFP